MISFLMMAKNVDKFIGDAIRELQKETDVNWELIVIDDGSEDKTFEVVQALTKRDERIHLEKNPFKGKVHGTSYAFSLSTGDIVKCIDSDDILKTDWFGFLPQMQTCDAHCHSALIVDENLHKLAKYNPNPRVITSSFEGVASNLLSLPKWSWSFKRSVAEKVFPLPSDLPFEDVWMAILIKKHAKNILVINDPLYLYRQHGSQTFGGIVNFRREVVQFRSARLLKLISVLESEERVLSGSFLGLTSFYEEKVFQSYLSGSAFGIKKLISLDISLKRKLKAFMYIYMPKTTEKIITMKWWLDAFIKN